MRPKVIAAVVVVLGLWTVWFCQIRIASYFDRYWNISAAGAWGDTFGALNALFSAFAFLAVLITLLRQREELKDQEKTQHLARFDSTFFQLLSLFRTLKNEIPFKVSDSAVSFADPSMGNEAMRRYRDRLAARVEQEGVDKRNKKQMANVYHTSVHVNAEGELSAYFRVIYTILRRIFEDQHLTTEQKASYGNLLRSQLTSAEVGLLGFNGLTEMSKDLARYITEFHMLKYLPRGEVREVLELHYDDQAFASRD